MKNRFKNVVLATLAAATLTAGATTQAHAGSDLRRALLGAVAVGIIAKEVKRNKDRRHDVATHRTTRSFDRRHRSHRHGSVRSHRRGHDVRRGKFRRSYRY